jgi:hypothetical protein
MHLTIKIACLNTRTFSMPKTAFSLLPALIFLGCTSGRVSSAPEPKLPAQAAPKTNTSTQAQKDEDSLLTKLTLTQVSQLQAALAKRDCKSIESIADDLPNAGQNNSTAIAFAIQWCAHQKSPKDKTSLERVLSSAEQIQKTESPFLNAAFIEQLKAESLEASGDTTAARAAFAKAMSTSALQFMTMVSGQTLRLDLQALEPLLTGAQSALLNEIRLSLSDNARQATALTKLDELLSQVPAGGVYDKLLAARLKLFAAFELSFASQLGTLEETRLQGNVAALENAAGNIRRLFPGRAHQQRIDSILGKTSSPESAANKTPAQQCAALTPAEVLGSSDRSDLTPDKAMMLAKTALNDGKPGDAVEILDSLSEVNKNERTRGLRREASEAHVKDMRRKASELYKRVAMTGDSQAKLDSLSQCKQILENILVKYPDTDSLTKRNIQKFLNSVSENITEIKKGQIK